MLENELEGTDQKSELQRYTGHIVFQGPVPARLQYLAEDVRYCRVTKTHDSNIKRLEVAFDPYQNDCWSRWVFLQLMRPKLAQMKNARVLMGQAPPGDLERVVQEMVGRPQGLASGVRFPESNERENLSIGGRHNIECLCRADSLESLQNRLRAIYLNHRGNKHVLALRLLNTVLHELGTPAPEWRRG